MMNQREAAENQGALAFREGRKLDTNPYPKDSELYHTWNDAWWERHDEYASDIEFSF